MTRSRFLLPLMAAVALPLTALATTTPTLAKNNNATAAAVVGGLIAGAAIGAAVSNSTHSPAIVVKPAPPPPPKKDIWANAFKPKPYITCYPVQHACYNTNGAYNASMTYKVFAR